MRKIVATLTQLAGVASLSVGGFVVHPAAGFGVLGVGLLALGIVTELDAEEP